MADTDNLIRETYAAFNRRDIDVALARMTDNIDWPKASEGGRVVGKDEIRAYWTRQWSEFDPHVEPLGIADLGDGRFDVQVQQLVKDLHGGVLSNQVIVHTFTVANGLIASMSISEAEPAFGR